MKKRPTLISKEIKLLLYIIVLLLCVVRVGEKNTITTYNVSGVSSVLSRRLEMEYVPPVVEEEVQVPEPKFYRLTSFYKDECTGSGLCKKDLQLNERGWYTYNGKIVIATATPYLINVFGAREGRDYFKYYDELRLTIDGEPYDAIVLDTCGACYWDQRIDLYVKDEASVTDRGYKGKNMISVEIIKKQ